MVGAFDLGEMFHHHHHHHSNHSKDLTYFDVRLKTHGLKNTVLVRGNESEIDNIPFEGHVKLSTNQDLHVRKIKLKLIGEQVVDYYSKSPDGLTGAQTCERNCILKVEWPNILCSSQGELKFGDYGDTAVKYHKVDNAARRSQNSSFVDLASLASESSDSSRPESPLRPGFHKTRSQPALFKNHESSLIKIPMSGIDGTPYPMEAQSGSENHSFLLPNGNYSMPFSFYLPANTPESVEGLSIGKIRYKLECSMERGRFDRSIKRSRHFRLIRTLNARNINLYESIEFANTWPEKIDFNVSLPRKALAIGSVTPVKLIIVPLAKGLTFKSLYAEIVQHATVKGVYGKSPAFETVIGRQKVDCHKKQINDDHWVIYGRYKLPASLDEITQSCTLKNELITVKHRMRVQIHIRNADGHVSELRANLPVMMFLSPSHGKVEISHLEVDQNGHFTNDSDPSRMDIVFPSSRAETPNDSETEVSDSEAVMEDEDEEPAPPIYTQHTKDMLYDQTSPRSPMEQLWASGSPSMNLDSYFERAASRSRAASPMPDLEALSKVPSYEEAVEEDSDENEPAPTYHGEDTVFGSMSLTPIPSSSRIHPLLQTKSSSMSNLMVKEKQSLAKKKHLLMRKDKF